MVNGCEPTRPGHWSALSVGDGDQAHVVKFPEQRIKVGNVESPVESGNSGNFETPYLGKWQVVEMKMHDIELVSFLGDGFNEIEVMCQGRKQLSADAAYWRRLAGVMGRVLAMQQEEK